MSHHPTLRRTVAIGATALVGLLALAGPASAHVTVNPTTAEAGGFTKLAFRVPTERDDASTTSVEVTFPAGDPIAFVSVRPKPGWTVEVERAATTTTASDGDEAAGTVTGITWTADDDDAAIGPGAFDEFEVSVGPLPEGVDELVFPAVQTYDSGEVVRWIDETVEGGSEPEHPAPVLALTAAGDEVAAGTDGGDGDSSDGLAIAGIVVGALGLVVGAAALVIARGTRRPAAR